MPETTVRLGMTNIIAGQADSTAPHNEALHKLDAIVGLSVLERGTNTPPVAAEGDAYIVGDTPTDEWATYAENDIAYYYDAQWNQLEPRAGFIAWVEDEGVMCRYTGSAWESETGESIYEGRKTNSQTIAGAGTNIEWNSDVRKNGIFTHNTAIDPDQIIVQEAGDYEAHAEVTLDYVSGASWQKVQFEFTVNGSTVAGSLARGAVDSNIDQLTISWSRIINLAAGDIFRVRGTHSAGGGSVQALADACRCGLRRK
jgi:hypothetical protein